MMDNLNSVSAMVAKMTPQQRQQFAAMHHDDPIIVSLTKFINDAEQDKIKALQNQQLMGQQQPPTVVDQELMAMAPPPMPMGMPPGMAGNPLPEEVGIGALPAPNLEQMAYGGIVGGDEDYDMGVGYADGGMVEHYRDQGLVGADAVLQQILSLNPEFDEAGNPRSKQERAFIEKRQADARAAAQRRQVYEAGIAATPSSELVESMEKFYKPRRTPESGTETSASSAAAASSAQEAQKPETAPTKREEKKDKADTGARPSAPAATTGGLDSLATAKRFLPDQGKAFEDYRKQELEAADAEFERIKRLMGEDKSKAYEGLEARIKKQEEAAGKKLDDEKSMAIFQAGLAIMGGTSPHAAVNIAAGALKGVEGFKEAKKDLEKAAREREKMIADIEQARRAEARDDRKTYMSVMQRVEDRKEKIRDSVFKAGMDLGMKQGELAAGFEKLAIQEAGDDRRARLQAAAANRTPEQMQMIERIMAEKKIPFSEAMAYVVGARREPMTREKALVEWMKPGAAAMVQAQFPNIKTFDDYWRAMSGGAGGAGGTAITPADQALINKYSR